MIYVGLVWIIMRIINNFYIQAIQNRSLQSIKSDEWRIQIQILLVILMFYSNFVKSTFLLLKFILTLSNFPSSRKTSLGTFLEADFVTNFISGRKIQKIWIGWIYILFHNLYWKQLSYVLAVTTIIKARHKKKKLAKNLVFSLDKIDNYFHIKLILKIK